MWNLHLLNLFIYQISNHIHCLLAGFSVPRASSKLNNEFGPEKAIDGKISEEH